MDNLDDRTDLADQQKQARDAVLARARQQFDTMRDAQPVVGSSPNERVRVHVDGFGDVRSVEIRSPAIDRRTAAALADDFVAAWRAAAGTRARADLAGGPMADQPGMAEFLTEHLDTRFGPARDHQTGQPARPARPAARRPDGPDDADETEQTYLKYGY